MLKRMVVHTLLAAAVIGALAGAYQASGGSGLSTTVAEHDG